MTISRFLPLFRSMIPIHILPRGLSTISLLGAGALCVAFSSVEFSSVLALARSILIERSSAFSELKFTSTAAAALASDFSANFSSVALREMTSIPMFSSFF